MQIPLLGIFFVFPRASHKKTRPVVGRLFSVFAAAVAEVIVVAVGVVAGRTGLLKPFVLVACVVYYKVHNNPYSLGV